MNRRRIVSDGAEFFNDCPDGRQQKRSTKSALFVQKTIDDSTRQAYV
jgi:hypothetical protein